MECSFYFIRILLHLKFSFHTPPAFFVLCQVCLFRLYWAGNSIRLCHSLFFRFSACAVFCIFEQFVGNPHWRPKVYEIHDKNYSCQEIWWKSNAKMYSVRQKILAHISTKKTNAQNLIGWKRRTLNLIGLDTWPNVFVYFGYNFSSNKLMK